MVEDYADDDENDDVLWSLKKAARRCSMSCAQFKREVMPFVPPVKTPPQQLMKRPHKRFDPQAIRKFIAGCAGEPARDPVLEAEEWAMQRMRRARAAAENRRAAG